ncbi:TetR family transcriptional regulator (plasmid) [Pseudonocardia sp. EC080610-09]|uniref:TetR/AcrR family transcriptional regulator n=1 Tax=unclassified Pseudonocardia TaxID=2619320 RepID=UPI000706BC1C|nr:MULTISPECIES: TetR/AcrR family transcriptional regulator [unclassified Pseudonocardia]ALL79891.1 TetR family transcriptional regulator [Pseudonocardia sp. EC080610-09]ALL85682.1 TetR family transcriptional regulator [Pseudonocardia sp. EC080619-01]
MPRRTISPDTSESADTKSARTRARLLDAAAKVLARKGFSGTRLQDIAEEANIQAPAIYYYYPSREDLIEAVLYEGATAMREFLTQRLAELPENTSPSDRLSTAVEAHLRHELELSDYARAVIRNANQMPDQFSRRALETVTEYNEIWRGLIDDLAAAGLLRADVVPSVGRMLVLGALNWSVEWWDPERGSLDEVISVAKSMVLHALRP